MNKRAKKAAETKSTAKLANVEVKAKANNQSAAPTTKRTAAPMPKTARPAKNGKASQPSSGTVRLSLGVSQA